MILKSVLPWKASYIKGLRGVIGNFVPSCKEPLEGKPKAKETEDLIPSGKSWVERISDSKRAKDDSEIVR
jgi:hypothetical protein